MTLKVFDRVEDAVRKLLVQGPSRKALTVTSLAEKYGLTENDLEATQGVEFTLKYSIAQELQDERVVCGVFSLICEHLGHVSRFCHKEVLPLTFVVVDRLAQGGSEITRPRSERDHLGGQEA